MVQIPADLRLKTEQLIEDAPVDDEYRAYLGISSIADECPRKLWYGFRICAKKDINPRKKRLFSRGHREEPIIIGDLEKIGIKVHSMQLSCITGNGHIKGHCDGLADNIPDAPKTTHLLEFKTASGKNFTKLKKEGVKKFSGTYYGQCICYMYLLGIKRTLFIAVNKDNDDRYYERIHEDSELAKELIKRGLDIISTEVPPPRPNGFTSTWFKCKWCDFYNTCFFDETILKTCRSCQRGDIHDEGVWKCSRYGIQLAFEQQLLSCDNYELLHTLK